MSLRRVLIGGALATAVIVFAPVGTASLGACNSGNGTCPDKTAVAPGGSCNDEHLQCAFDLTTPAAECDGTQTVIATSCTCNHGAWECPDPFECEAGAATEAGDDAGGDEGGDDAASGDAATE